MVSFSPPSLPPPFNRPTRIMIPPHLPPFLSFLLNNLCYHKCWSPSNKNRFPKISLAQHWLMAPRTTKSLVLAKKKNSFIQLLEPTSPHHQTLLSICFLYSICICLAPVPPHHSVFKPFFCIVIYRPLPQELPVFTSKHYAPERPCITLALLVVRW